MFEILAEATTEAADVANRYYIDIPAGAIPLMGGIGFVIQWIKTIPFFKKNKPLLPVAAIGLGIAACYLKNMVDPTGIPDPVTTGIALGLLTVGSYETLSKAAAVTSSVVTPPDNK